MYKDRKDLYAAQKRHRIKIRALLFEYLSARSCVDCGERDPVVLEFDHRDQKEKSSKVSRILSGHYSWRVIKLEIDKCDVRCANCHRRRTYIQLGEWGRTKPLSSNG